MAGPVGEIWFEDDPDSALLIKYLFTSAKLSIQVHPSDQQARAIGHPRGKDEAWYVISAEPEAVIGAGFDKALTADELHSAALDGSIDTLMTWHKVNPGDFFYVPAGTVHAIGAGVSLLEIQQNVDLTYRLFDYGRPRELQLEEGLAVSKPEPFAHCQRDVATAPREMLAAGPKLVIERLMGPSDQAILATAESPGWLIPIAGTCRINGTTLPVGSVWLTDTPTNVQLGPDDCLIAAAAGSELGG
ncbi:class I mannose-6-phosphate isomerase [Novosphingobium sp. MW5]|nr:class I mannose-6-phosphate isomerase [Novosphingobium sp. MW5]